MAVTVRHATLTAVPDDPAYDVGADEWNEYHTVTNAVDKTGDTMTGQMTVAQGTITTSQPFTWTQTWNAGAVTFTGLKLNVTDTASASSSLLLDLQVGGSSVAWIDKAGQFSTTYRVNTTTVFLAGVVVLTGAVKGSDRTLCSGFSNDADQYYGAYGYKFFDPADGSTLRAQMQAQASGVVQVNNGTAGTYRDLTARNLITNPTTVAGLTGATQGARAFVTDATQTLTAGIGAIVAGGGANAVPVHYDGTNWRIG